MRARLGSGLTVALLLIPVVSAAIGGAWYWWHWDREDNHRGRGDAAVQQRRGDDRPVTVYNMPDGFGNLATKCVGVGRRAYTTTHFDQGSGDDAKPTNANFVVVPDPLCH